MPHRLLFALLALPLVAADWPQFRGPNRDGKSPETGLSDLSGGAPKLLWTVKDLGNAYSGPSIVGGKVYTLGGDSAKANNAEYAVCLNEADGKEVWRTPLSKYFENGWGGGPRSNPTVDGDRLYALTGTGDLACLKTDDGSIVWKKSFSKDFGGKMMSGWGFCESPLVDGDRVVVAPGGDGGTLAALDKATGKPVWRSKELTDPAAYASICAHTIGGVKQYVTMTNKGVVGVRAADGKLLWKAETAKNPTAVIPTPVVDGDRVFVTSGYGAGCGLVKVSAQAGSESFTAEEEYANKDMSNHHGGVVLLDGHVFGHSDRKGWTCMELATGKVKWAEPKKHDKGSIAYADGKLYLYGEGTHTLVCIKASTAGYEELGRFTIPEETKIRSQRGKTWTHPVIANGKLYLRDQDLLFCFELK